MLAMLADRRGTLLGIRGTRSVYPKGDRGLSLRPSASRLPDR
jgi:hypothetical protein